MYNAQCVMIFDDVRDAPHFAHWANNDASRVVPHTAVYKKRLPERVGQSLSYRFGRM